MQFDNLSDILFKLKFSDETGAIPVPDCGIDIELFVYTNKVAKATKRGATFANCVLDTDGIIVTFDKPDLGVGKLKMRTMYAIPDERFTDGMRNESKTEIIGEIV